ncbi:MAG: hypothetical protein QG646_786 [Euryarchaeota archaeon]|nr:hypothetical protein [Euryarchaeota archaeon]
MENLSKLALGAENYKALIILLTDAIRKSNGHRKVNTKLPETSTSFILFSILFS